MNRIFRTFVTLPALIIALIVIPTVALSASASDDANFFWNMTQVNDHASAALQQPGGTSPLPTVTSTPGGTVPMPTATATRRPPVVYPTATPYYRPRPVQPTATATAVISMPTDEFYINNIRIEKVIVVPNSNTLYAINDDGWLYRSDNGGTIWMLVSTTPKVTQFVVSSANPDVLYGTTGLECEEENASSAMYKSVDGGTTWLELPNGMDKTPLLVNPTDEETLFAAGCDMLFLSTDGGLTWVAKPDNSPDALWSTYRVLQIVAASLVGDPTPDSPNWNQLFAGGVDEEGTGVVAFSNDMGDTWVRLTPNISPAPWSLTALTVDPYTEGLVAFSEPRSVWFTENFGVNWQVTTKGLNNVLDRGISGAPFGLNDIFYHRPSGKLFLATARGLYMKSAASNTWTKVDDTSFDLENLTDIAYSESNPNQLWLTSDDGVFVYEIE